MTWLWPKLFFWTLFRHPGILKVPTFWVFTLSFEFFPWVLSFFLEFWPIFSCFSHKTFTFYRKMSENLGESADFFRFELEFWVFSLSFEFFALSFFPKVQKKVGLLTNWMQDANIISGFFLTFWKKLKPRKKLQNLCDWKLWQNFVMET